MLPENETKQSKNQKWVSRIRRKFKECSYCGKLKPIFRNIPHKGPQCEDCYRVDKTTSKHKRAKQERRKPSPDYIKEADKVCSMLIRRMYVMGSGYLSCYTCDKPMTIVEAQCGHFIPRANLGTRWLLDNCRPQCEECNVHKSGNLEVFEQRLNNELPGVVDKLRDLARLVSKPTQPEIKEVIESMKKRLKELKS